MAKTPIRELFPYPKLSTHDLIYRWRKTPVTKEDAKKINEWCRNPERVKEVWRRYHEWLDKQVEKKGDKYFQNFGTF